MSDHDQECVDLPMIHGKAVKMECLRGYTNEEYKDAISPFYLSATYRITYEDGAEVEIGTLFAYTLSQGSFWYFKDSKVEYIESVFARDTRVLEYLARVGASLKREQPGECTLLSEEEAERILAEMDVPPEGLKYGSRMAGENMGRWIKDWQQRGLIKWVEENNMGWVIASKARQPMPQQENKQGYLGDLFNAQKNRTVLCNHTDIQDLENNTDDHDRLSKSAEAVFGERETKAIKIKPMKRWPKNKAEHRENQILLWGGEANLAQFETREMKTSAGKVCTYHVKVDPSGRLRILDTGEDAPAGYYSQSSRYYALKRNARVARRYSTEGQRALWCAHIESFKFPTGFLDQLGNRGLIRKMDGKYAEMNFAKSARGRKFLDMCKTYFPEEGIIVDGARLNKPRYTMIIEQVRIRPDSFEACFQ